MSILYVVLLCILALVLVVSGIWIKVKHKHESVNWLLDESHADRAEIERIEFEREKLNRIRLEIWGTLNIPRDESDIIKWIREAREVADYNARYAAKMKGQVEAPTKPYGAAEFARADVERVNKRVPHPPAEVSWSPMEDKCTCSKHGGVFSRKAGCTPCCIETITGPFTYPRNAGDPSTAIEAAHGG